MAQKFEFDIKTVEGTGHAIITVDHDEYFPGQYEATLVIDRFDESYEILSVSLGENASPAYNLFVTWDSLVEMTSDYHPDLIDHVSYMISKWPDRFYFSIPDAVMSQSNMISLQDVLDPAAAIMHHAFIELDTKTCMDIATILDVFGNKRAYIYRDYHGFSETQINKYSQEIREAHFLDLEWTSHVIGPWYLYTKFEYRDPFHFKIMDMDVVGGAQSMDKDHMRLLEKILAKLGLKDSRWTDFADSTLPRMEYCGPYEIGAYAIFYTRVRPLREVPDHWWKPDAALIQYQDRESMEQAYQIANEMNEDYGLCYDIRKMRWVSISVAIAEQEILERAKMGGFVDWVNQNFEEV